MPVQILSLLLNDRQAWQHRVNCKSHCSKSCQVMRPHQGLNMLPDALLALVRVLGAEDCQIAKPNEWCLPLGKEIPLDPQLCRHRTTKGWRISPLKLMILPTGSR